MVKRRFLFVLFLFSFSSLYILKFLGVNHRLPIEFLNIYFLIKNIFNPIIILLVVVLSLSSKEIFNIKLIGVGGACLLTSFYAKDFSLVNAFFLVLATKYIDFKKLFIFLFILSAFVFCFMIIDFLFSYSHSEATFILDDIYGIRYTFQMDHPNNISIRLFCILTLYILLRDGFYLFEFFLSSILVCFLYYFTHSRTGLIINLFLLCSFYVYNKYNYMNLLPARLSLKFIFFIFLTFSFFVTSFFSNDDFYSILNSIFSGRISMAYKTMSSLDMSVFPRDISLFLSENNIVLDNMYMYFILCLGLGFSFLCCILFYKLFVLLFRNEMYKESLVIFFTLLYGLLEKVFTDVYFNIMLLFFSFIVYPWKMEKYKERYERFN